MKTDLNTTMTDSGQVSPTGRPLLRQGGEVPHRSVNRRSGADIRATTCGVPTRKGVFGKEPPQNPLT